MTATIGRRTLLKLTPTTILTKYTGAFAAESPVEILISAGQSWRTNAFPSFAALGITPSPNLLALQVKVGRGGAAQRLEPLPNGSGIWIPGQIVGTTSYQGSDRVTIGRCAVLAQQAFRRRAELATRPILEFCMAYPGSSWDRGRGGGLKPGSLPWNNGLRLIQAVEQFVPNPAFRSVGWTQGGERDRTAKSFAEMTQAYDALKLPGTAAEPLNYYIGLPSGLSNDPDLTRRSEFRDIYDFCRRNANNRTWGTTPWYQWPFSRPGEVGYSNVHTGPYGTARHGEIEGYARFVVEDEGEGRYYPLWQSMKRQMALLDPHTIMVPFDRPSGSAFRNSRLQWCWEKDDGIELAPQYGWQVRVDGKPLSLSPTLDGLNVYLKSTTPIPRRRPIEVSYAMYGPQGSDPGLHAAALGNLMIAGPPSVFFSGKTVNAWAWQFSETTQF